LKKPVRSVVRRVYRCHTFGEGMKEFVVGVDVGTESVRAGVFDASGRMLGIGGSPLQLWRPQEDFIEQSSVQIWQATCAAVREALKSSGISRGSIKSISFDATCSLVAIGKDGRPVTISPSGDDERNVILWADHRAIEQAKRINESHHRVLKYVGGRLSPEQEPPKLLWIKENLPQTWRRAGKFFDLADFLSWRATGQDLRSVCTFVCKWCYLAHRNSWDRSFYRKISFGDLFEGQRLGEVVAEVGSFAGKMTAQAASEMGLTTDVTVAIGIIDAHAGGLGCLGAAVSKEKNWHQVFQKTIALIDGTSSCLMAVSAQPRFIKGIWGPYLSAMVPGMWLNKGGQSATGALIDFTIKSHHLGTTFLDAAQKQNTTVYALLNKIVAQEKKIGGFAIIKDLHVLPYHHGNRSPLADPRARGTVNGLTLDSSKLSLAKLYYATIQSIAYGTRHIIEAMNAHGYEINHIVVCGGGTKNPLWLKENADITGCEIPIPREPEAVLLGTAMLAAVGAGIYRSVAEAMKMMSKVGRVMKPENSTREFHDAKYAIFKEMYKEQLKRRKAMERFRVA